jgi:hypothetical protein
MCILSVAKEFLSNTELHSSWVHVKLPIKIKSFLSSNEGNLSKSTPLMGSTKRANKTITHYLI